MACCLAKSNHYLNYVNLKCTLRYPNYYFYHNSILFIHDLLKNAFKLPSAKWRPFSFSGLNVLNEKCPSMRHELICSRNHCVCVPSQWKIMLHCNIVSHWLGTYTQWPMLFFVYLFQVIIWHTGNKNIHTSIMSYFFQSCLIFQPYHPYILDNIRFTCINARQLLNWRPLIYVIK